jgi:hypothetical protein
VVETLAVSLRVILVLLVLLVGGLVWLLLVDEESSEPGKETPVERLIGYAPEAVRAIEISSGPEREARLERDQHGDWWVTRPIRWEADPGKVEALLRDLSRVSVLKVVTHEPAGELDAFGLARPEARLLLFTERDEPARRLELGGASPLGEERYVRDETGAVLLVDGSVARILHRVPGSFMERRFVPVEQGEVREIAVQGPASSFRLERRDDRWWITGPFEDLADRGMVTDMLWALDGLTAVEVLDADEIDLARGAFDESVTLTFDTGRGDPWPGVEIGAPAGPDRWFARRPGDPSFWGIIAATSLRLLAREAEELRERRVVSFSRPEVREVRIESTDAVLTISRSEPRSWTVSDGHAVAEDLTGEPVEAFLDRLRWLRARGFGSGGGEAGGKILEIVVAGDDADLGSLTLERLIGVHDPAGATLLGARSSWRPGVSFTIDAAFLDAVPTSVEDLRELSEEASRAEETE